MTKLSSELEAARLARRKENRERENLLNRFATMLDALPGGVIILDSDDAITEANPQARALLGEPLEGHSWTTIEQRGRFNSQGSFEIRGRRLNISTCPLPGGSETSARIRPKNSLEFSWRDGGEISASDTNSFVLHCSLCRSIV